MKESYLKVLIIDADPVARALLGMQLKKMCLADNIFAKNGEEARTLLKKDPTNLIICGVSVPEVDALELRKACKEDPRLTKIPFIIMGSGKLLMAEALEAGMNAYIVHPVSPDELQKVLKQIDGWPFPHGPPEKE